MLITCSKSRNESTHKQHFLLAQLGTFLAPQDVHIRCKHPEVVRVKERGRLPGWSQVWRIRTHRVESGLGDQDPQGGVRSGGSGPTGWSQVFLSVSVSVSLSLCLSLSLSLLVPPVSGPKSLVAHHTWKANLPSPTPRTLGSWVLMINTFTSRPICHRQAGRIHSNLGTHPSHPRHPPKKNLRTKQSSAA